jgi:hypothetical protein
MSTLPFHPTREANTFFHTRAKDNMLFEVVVSNDQR